MPNRVSNLIFFDHLFTPFYYFSSWIIPFFFSRKVEHNKVIAIKFFGMGSIVRLANVLKNSERLKPEVELITLHKNKEVCDLLGLKAHYIRSENLFLFVGDIVRAMYTIWKMKDVKIVDLERISNLSGIFRLFSAVGKSCSSFTFKDENFESKKQTFISLKDKPAIQGILEILESRWKENVAEAGRVTKNRIIVNINAGEYLPQRRYPVQYFAEVINLLHQKNQSFEFVLTGSKKEVDYTKQLTIMLDELGLHYINMAGELSLPELAHLLQESSLLITNDSGPLHLAYYYETPTVAIWGPTSSRLVGYPESHRMKNLSLEKKCSPCFIHPKSKVAKACLNQIDCLTELNPRSIVDSALQLLQYSNQTAVNVN